VNFIFLLVAYGVFQIANQFFRHRPYSLVIEPYQLAPMLNLTAGFSVVIEALVHHSIPSVLVLAGMCLVALGSIIGARPSFKKEIK
jgi:hypothetical protein